MNEPGDIASLILRIVRGESGECLEAIGDFVRAELGTLGYPDREGLVSLNMIEFTHSTRVCAAQEAGR